MTEQRRPGWLDQSTYEFIYKQVPRLCLDMLVRTNGGVVLGRRNVEPNIGLWHFPGGRLMYQESFEDAVRRITKTELDIDVESARQVGIINAQFDGPWQHSVSIVYQTDVENVSLKPGDIQSSELKVFRSVPEDMFPYQQEFLRNYPQVFA